MLHVVLELAFIQPSIIVENRPISIFYRPVVDILDFSEIHPVLVLLYLEIGDVDVLERLAMGFVFFDEPFNAVLVEGLTYLMLPF